MPRSTKAQLGRSLSLWAAAVVTALGAQRLLVTRQVQVALLLYALACLFVVASSFTLSESGLPAFTASFQARANPRSWLKAAGLALLAAGCASLLASLGLLVASQTSTFALPLWVAALLFLPLGLILRHGPPWRVKASGLVWPEILLLGAILAVGILLRSWNLASIPADVHGDEAAIGLAARQILHGGVANVFGTGWASLPQLSFSPYALSLRLFGDDLFGLRVASVVQGSLSIALLYGVGRRLFSARVAAIAAFLLAVSQMAIHYSRIGNNYVSALFASLLLFYFLLRALDEGHPVDYLFTGFAAGITLNVYYAARIAPLLGALYCLHRILGERGFLARHWRGFGILVAGSLVFAAPQLVFYAHNSAPFTNRAAAVFLFRPENLAHQYSADQVHTLAELMWRQFIRS
ncbi:MAG: glycosyltransferase family 39 protein, partial [Chloroflexota bacterium]|nr:glycosyltransferase family 39 protein [Chloroflexota bacterium]